MPARLLRRRLGVLILILTSALALVWWWPRPAPPVPPNPDLLKIPVTLDVDGYVIQTTTNRPTVDEALAQWNVAYADDASIIPPPSHTITAYDTISIRHRFPVAILVDGQEIGDMIFAMPIGSLLLSHGITLNPLDRIDAEISSLCSPGQMIRIVRVVEEIAVLSEEIPYTISYVDDDTMSIIEKDVSQGGSNGTREVTIKRTFVDGEIESEEELSSVVVSEPVEKVITRGTLIIIGDSEEGYASYYDNPTGAASVTFPRGTYVRVTSQQTGRSVIVHINDRGPDQREHPDRIIDLDESDFFALDPPWYAGTIYVTVEELL
ncbi:hypothetical protein AUK40_01510 [Candidatus Wirthbacteria bacterium CG2_30_54_11]|uniref:G5 domain-containing protein n=1 Tax=Candidatus Wirthbacteria bacterium CG2_30_54_11 TaxID=1817892 RepID=A0A1J5IZ78_9BACT|nr:MAG: hypothetical protein AUK40_01510 [Candidatus Wirthbacteria bacterium CG2_30_54_11]